MHRQLLLESKLQFVITAELGREREKSRLFPVGKSSQIRAFGQKCEASKVLYRASPFINDSDMQSYPSLLWHERTLALMSLLNMDSSGAISTLH